MIFFLLKMNKEINFHLSKNPIFIHDIGIGKLLLSHMVSSGEKNYKYFIGYLYGYYKTKPL